MLYTKSGRSLWQITLPRWEPTSLTARRLGDSPSRTPPLSNFRHCSRPSWNNQEVQFLQKLAHIGCRCWRMKELEMFECLTIDYRTQSTFPTIIITLKVSTSVWQGHSMIGDYWLQQWIKICLTNQPKKCKWWHFDKKKTSQVCNLIPKMCQTNIWWTAIAPSRKNCKKYLSYNPCFALESCPAMMSVWLLVSFLFVDDDDGDTYDDAFTCWRCSWLSLRRCLSASPLQHQACRRLPTSWWFFKSPFFGIYSFKTLI